MKVSDKIPFSVFLRECVPLRALCRGYLSNSRCQWAQCFTRCNTGSLLLVFQITQKGLGLLTCYPCPISVCQGMSPAWSLGPRLHCVLLFAVMPARDLLHPRATRLFWGLILYTPPFSLSTEAWYADQCQLYLMEVEIVVMTSPCPSPSGFRW